MKSRTPEQDAERRSEQAMRAALVEAGAKFTTGRTCTCPFHEDGHASAGYFVGDDGALLFKCHVCDDKPADVFDILARTRRIPVADVLAQFRTSSTSTPSRPRVMPAEAVAPKPPRQFASTDALKAAINGLEDLYVYTNPETMIGEMAVVRISTADGKTFRQYRPIDGGGWEEKSPAKPWPIFNRTRVARADVVIVVEGEKCVKALADAGWTATTSPGGAGKAAHADWSPLTGKKRVILWPDNDPPNPPGKPNPGKRTGWEHMQDVGNILAELPTPPVEILILEPDDLALPAKGDAVDFILEYGGDTRESKWRAVEAVVTLAAPFGPPDELEQLFEDTIAGKRRALPLPWPQLMRLARPLMPATLTSLCGDPGSSKSLLILEAAIYWHENGVRVAILMLEDTRAYHLNRMLAQLDNRSELMDPDWVEKHPNEARAARLKHQPFLRSFRNCITAATDEGDTTLGHVLAWIERQCRAGAQVIVVDPVTAAGHDSDRSWQEDRDFVIKAKGLAKRYGVRLVFSTHPKGTTKKGNGAAIHGMAGGAAYPRFSHCVLWLTAPDKPKRVTVTSGDTQFNTDVNRTIRIAKARNGPGSRMEIGYHFDGASLRFAEQGVIVKEKREGGITSGDMNEASAAADAQAQMFSPEDLP